MSVGADRRAVLQGQRRVS
ncbi:Adenylate cyclase [Caballeronia sordidicola]|uniref:Adenylate cyclase n=1 Tax=Caballeronia sordidicola TaxID=196367 RepID=A0A242MRT8_CABSO|nr:Adenylate cyclase [Caballeronia sordidicola]